MNILNTFRVIRVVQTGLAEPVATFSANVALYVAIVCIADAIFPVSFASAFRTRNGGQGFQFLFALPFLDNVNVYNGNFWYEYAAAFSFAGSGFSTSRTSSTVNAASASR